jgi:Chaperone for flagella basal body P-ring formation
MKVLLSIGWAIAAVASGASSLLPQASLSGDGAPVGDAVRGALVREMDDPSTGNRWLLERDLEHPGGPGRLVLAAGSRAGFAKVGNGGSSVGEAISAVPVIRVGDAVTLVAHTAVMDAQLEAVALAPAAAGAAFPVRLKIGGRVVQAIALGARRARWAPESGGTR